MPLKECLRSNVFVSNMISGFGFSSEQLRESKSSRVEDTSQ